MTELISTRLEPGLAEKLRAEAGRERRTISNFVRMLIQDSLAARSAQPDGISR